VKGKVLKERHRKSSRDTKRHIHAFVLALIAFIWVVICCWWHFVEVMTVHLIPCVSKDLGFGLLGANNQNS